MATRYRKHIVAVSGHGDDAARIKSRKAGFDAHVTKPVDVDLIEVIIEQLDTHS